MKPSLEAVAHHEAGHAVAAVMVGRRFHHVTIAENEAALGHVLYCAWEKRFDPDMSWTPRTQMMLRDAVMTAYAGLAAEAKFTGKNNWIGARSDLKAAADLASTLAGTSTRSVLSCDGSRSDE